MRGKIFCVQIRAVLAYTLNWFWGYEATTIRRSQAVDDGRGFLRATA